MTTNNQAKTMVVAVDNERPRRQAAAVATADLRASIERTRSATSLPAIPIVSPAETIAESVSVAAGEIMRAAIPYGSHNSNRDFAAEAEIEHHAADGSTTRARLSFKYGRL